MWIKTFFQCCLFTVVVIVLSACGGGGSSNGLLDTTGGGSSTSLSSSSTTSSSSSVASSSSSVASSSSETSSSASSSDSESSSSTSSSSSESSASSASSSISISASGLSARPTNTTCLAGDKPATTSSIQAEVAFPNVTFTRPTALLQAPGDGTRWYIAEKGGRIYSFDNTPDVNSSQLFADLTDRVSSSPNEAGLLAFTFHPNYASNGRVFVFYQTNNPATGDCCMSRLASYTTNGGSALDLSTETILMEYSTPYENHFGGQLGFDGNGYLYLSIGDGGDGGDPGNRAQNTRNIFGTFVRLNVDSGSPYSIPGDNPFASESGLLCNNDANMATKESNGENCSEIFAWGLRNPWRWSFDRSTGDIWAGDVGQSRWEEINIIQLGGNYGWRLREGAHCYNPATDCPTAGLIEPVGEVEQPTFQSITGGYVYRGSTIPSLVGKYVFGDYQTGRIYALADDGDGGREIEVLDGNGGLQISSFAEDQLGELYLLNYWTQSVYRLVDNSGGSQGAPELLSQTGCVNPSNPSEPVDAMIPYDMNALFWSDGAFKRRWFAIPDGQTVTVDQSDQDWDFPVGSVLMKSFWLGEELIETRLLKHHNDGSWAGYTYAWNNAGTDADLVVGGRVVNVNGQSWLYPSGSQCLECHTSAAGRALGPETAQLHKHFTYPSTGLTANQVDTLEAIGVLSGATNDVAVVDPYQTDLDLNARARAWLHTNCASCHRPGGLGNVDIDMRFDVALAAMNICNVAPQNGDLGVTGAQRLSPGNANTSMVFERMNRRGDAQQMPPIGSFVVDSEGVTLIRNWINSLSSCE